LNGFQNTLYALTSWGEALKIMGTLLQEYLANSDVFGDAAHCEQICDE